MALDLIKDLERALKVLKDGGIILYPTDTIWGLGCDASNEEAVERLFNLKKRSDAKAMISLVDSLETLQRWVKIVPVAALQEIREANRRPLTIIYDSPIGLSPSLKASDGSAAFRITNHRFSKSLCFGLGLPLVSTSANISNEATPTSFGEISQDIIVGVDYVCQTDRTVKGSKPSRVLKVSNNGSKTIIRE